jgi:hypothetical protein
MKARSARRSLQLKQQGQVWSKSGRAAVFSPRRDVHRGSRALLPSRKSTKPPADSCGREVPECGSSCCCSSVGRINLLLPVENLPTSITPLMVVVPDRLRQAACPSEITVIEPPCGFSEVLELSVHDGDGIPLCRIHHFRRRARFCPFWAPSPSRYQFRRSVVFQPCVWRYDDRVVPKSGSEPTSVRAKCNDAFSQRRSVRAGEADHDWDPD